MRIDGRTEQLSKVQAQEFRPVGCQELAKDRTQAMRRADQVTLSTTAQELTQLNQAMATLPPDREERVAALREAVRSGSYQIPEDELIDRLMGVVSPER